MSQPRTPHDFFPLQCTCPIHGPTYLERRRRFNSPHYTGDTSKFRQSTVAVVFVLFLCIYSVWNTCGTLDRGALRSHADGHFEHLDKERVLQYQTQQFRYQANQMDENVQYASLSHQSNSISHAQQLESLKSFIESPPSHLSPDISIGSVDSNKAPHYVDKFDQFDQVIISTSKYEAGNNEDSDLENHHVASIPSSINLPIDDLFQIHDEKSQMNRPPGGFPWHRWGGWKSDIESSSATAMPTLDVTPEVRNIPNHTMDILRASNNYPLNAHKFISILAKHGKKKKVSTPFNQLLSLHNKLNFTKPFISGKKVKVFIFRNGTLLCENGESGYWENYQKNAKGYHIDWYKLAMNALNMAKSLEDAIPNMKLLTEGDFPVIFDNADYPWCDSDLVPIFRTNLVADERDCNYAWPGLSLMFLTGSENLQLRNNKEQWHETFEENEENYPWAKKISQAVWRGRMTGYDKLFPNSKTPRMRLHRKDMYYPEMFDVKFIPMNSNPSRNYGIISHENEKYRMNAEEFMKYKAIIDIDGFAWSSRFGNLLCMNSVVVKVEPDFINYFEKDLVPWVDYVPVKSDLSDLDEVVKMVLRKENDAWMKDIVENSNEFCSRKFIYDQLTTDFLWTLLSYAELLRDAPGFYEEWSRNKDAYHLPARKMAPHSQDDSRK